MNFYPTRCCGTCIHWLGNSTMNWAEARCQKHPELEDFPVAPSWLCEDFAWDGAAGAEGRVLEQAAMSWENLPT